MHTSPAQTPPTSSTPKIDVHAISHRTPENPALRTTIDVMRTLPWRVLNLSHPALIFDMKQTSQEERLCQYWLAQSWYTGAGEIIDAGCLAGNATHAFATGLSHNPRVAHKAGRVHAYDLFKFDDYMKPGFDYCGITLNRGDSFYEHYKTFTAPVRAHITDHPGDFHQETWPAHTPIEVLHVDVAKTWSLEQHLSEQMLTSLIPGRSLILHQDYFHPWAPWVHIRAELLKDHLEYVCRVHSGTAVFAVKDAIPPRLATLHLQRDLSPQRRTELFDAAMNRFDGADRAFLLLARAVLMIHHKDFAQARTTLDEASPLQHLDEGIKWELPSVEAYLASALAAQTPPTT